MAVTSMGKAHESMAMALGDWTYQNFDMGSRAWKMSDWVGAGETLPKRTNKVERKK